MNNRQIIGKCQLQNLLIKARLSPTELPYKINISVQQLSAYMYNKRIMSLPTARVISKIIRCKIDDLYDWSDNIKLQTNLGVAE
jgi:DNA-binding XRE family transcriptional regulator